MYAIVCYMLLPVRLSVCLAVCHTGGCIDVARLPLCQLGFLVSDDWQMWTDFNNSSNVHNNFQMNCKLILDNVLAVHADSPLLHTVPCEISL